MNVSMDEKRARKAQAIDDFQVENGTHVADATVPGVEPQSEAPKGESVAASFPSISIGEVPEDSAVRWLVHGLWTAEGCGVVGGEPKSFKSFLTNHVAVCVAAGLPVLGRFPTVKGRVLMFNAEDRPRMTRRRIGRMCRALDLDIAALDLKLIDVPALRLDDAGTVDKLRATVERERPTLLVLDPLRNLHGLDENDAKIVSALLAPLRLIQRDFKCAVMVVHHLAKAQPDTQRRPGQRLRGSSALHGWLDSALYLTRQANDSIAVIAEHREAAELSEPLAFKLREQTLDSGEALWLEPVELEKADKSGDDARVLAILREASGPLSGDAIRKAFGGNKDRSGDAVKRMAQDGRIEMVKYDGLDAMGRKHVFQGWRVADAR